MELYDKLTAKYPAEHFSVNTTKTMIEEDEPQAVTRSVTIEHQGTEVLKINKTLFVEVRDATHATIPTSISAEVCDGAISTEEPSLFFGYVELKSACTANNVLKARSQILASFQLMQNVADTCDFSFDKYVQKGIIVTQPITDETLTKARQRRQRDLEQHNDFSPSRFLLNLIEGKAKEDSIGLNFVSVFTPEIVSLSRLL